MPGIGDGFIPSVLNQSVPDEVIAVDDESAFLHAKRLAAEEGILAGVSSGAALAAALQIARRNDSTAKTIVVLLGDTGERYVSTGLFKSTRSARGVDVEMTATAGEPFG